MLDDRQAGADRGLVAKARRAARGGRADGAVALDRPGAGLLVRRDDMDAGSQPVGVVRRDRVAGAAVDDDGVRQMRMRARARANAARSHGSLAASMRSRQPVPSMPRSSSHMRRLDASGAHAQVEMGARAFSRAAAAAIWSSSVRADIARPDHADRHGLWRKIKCRMALRAARARRRRAAIATEMLRSEAPWAMARMFTPARASASNRRAATPGVPAMRSPTAASTAMSGVSCTPLIWPAPSSRANAPSSAAQCGLAPAPRARRSRSSVRTSPARSSRPRPVPRAAPRTRVRRCRARRSCRCPRR